MDRCRKPAALVLLLCALVAAAGCRRETRAAESRAATPAAQPAAGAETGWVRTFMADPRVAPVFTAARERGLEAAQDKLERITARDGEVRAQGHQIAHALGRYAVALAGHRADVFARCRANFQSGCYHGVLEAYLERAPVDAQSVAGLCGAITRPGGPRLQARECAHGLGHGLTARFGHDIHPALRACDGLPAEDVRVECWDGVFMENAVHGLGEGGHHGGGDSVGAHAAHGAAPRPKSIRAEDPAFPCDSVADKYQPSCWHYQHRVVWVLSHDRDAPTLRTCDLAPAAAAPSCYRGVGKQVAGERPEDAAATVEQCRAGSAALAGWCIAGAAEYYVDLAWRTDLAHTFCARVPADLRDDCYGMIGSRLALIHTAPRPIRADCRRAPDASSVRACLKGAGVEES